MCGLAIISEPGVKVVEGQDELVSSATCDLLPLMLPSSLPVSVSNLADE